jgi:hypothetical protein
MAGAEIDDAQPAHAERTPALHMKPFVVGTAMPDLIAHRAHQGNVGVLLTKIKTGDAAHFSLIIANHPCLPDRNDTVFL